MEVGRPVARVLGSIRRQGWLESLRMVRAEVGFVARHGWATRGFAESIANGAHSDSLRYEPARVWSIRRALAKVPGSFIADGAFLDLGCGKGRALLVAAEQPFARLIGVEIDAALAEVARGVVRPLGSRASIVTGDVATEPVPDDATVVFLFNPFGADTLAQALDRLVESTTRRPRPVAVIYVNPVHASIVVARGFSVRWRGPDAILFTGPAPGSGTD